MIKFRVPSTVEEFEFLERNLVGRGVFRRFPRPKGFTHEVPEACVTLWRGVLDQCWLDLLRGPVSPYPGSEQSVKEWASTYRDWLHWIYEVPGDDFMEVCDLALLDHTYVKDILVRSIKARREVFRDV